jgi:RNA-directed DNA polymerase
MLIIEPIFEADFMDCSYGFRPKRSAHDALKEVQQHLKEGFRGIYDADLKGYFDSIPHDDRRQLFFPSTTIKIPGLPLPPKLALSGSR